MRNFWKNRDGNVAMLTGLSVLPLVVLAGAAIDMAVVITDKNRIHHALDIAALNTARELTDKPSLADKPADVLEFAAAAFHLNYTGSTRAGTNVTTKDSRLAIDLSQTLVKVNGVVQEVVLSAAGKHKTNFMRIMIGNTPVNTKTTSAATVRNDTFDVVMVLDNSGSMDNDGKIGALRTAAEDLTNTLMGMNVGTGMSDRVKIGLVPFSGYVNVGSANKSASWMDTEGASPIHSENFDATANRFTLFDQIKNVTWQGCVESRPSPYDIDDTAPSTGTPATLFVPIFAPDEPDDDNDNDSRKNPYTNNYLDDEGGTCTGRAPSGSKRPELSQNRLCKYDKDVSPSSDARKSNGTTEGPNYRCYSTPILPVTNTKKTVVDAIKAMKANGPTNIHQGIMWGWRTLSKGEPFTESRDDNKKNHIKAMVVMTDGQNDYGSFPSGSHNESKYGAYGFAELNRISASNKTDDDKWDDRMDVLTATACTNAKAAKIKVYTIAFQVDDKDTEEMLKKCATRSDMYFSSASNAELKAAFQEIAESISKLRLSQ
ncbi:MAG: pilus assembly protein TadG-related protein [Pseudomonadota bacterium]